MFAQTTFIDATINSNDSVLFNAQSNIPAHGDINTLLRFDIEDDRWTAISHFPEVMKIAGLPHNTKLFLYNHFGLFQSKETDSGFGTLEAVRGFPSFEEYQMRGPLYSISPSPNGEHVLYYQPSSASLGDLVLLDVQSGENRVVIQNYPLRTSEEAAKWSPSGKYFIYEREGKLYYFTLGQTVIAERFRYIGPGTLDSVEWQEDSSLYYILNSLIYHFVPSDLFIATVYHDIIRNIHIRGELQIEFDPSVDRFFVSPNEQNIAVLKANGRLLIQKIRRANIFIKPIPITLFQMPSNELVLFYFWVSDDGLKLFTRRYDGEKRSRMIFIQGKDSWDVQETEFSYEIQKVRLSPNRHHIALLDTGGTLRIYAANNGQKILSTQNDDHYVEMQWSSPVELVLGGKRRSIRVDIFGERVPVAISQFKDYGFLRNQEGVYLRLDNNETMVFTGATWREGTSRDTPLPPKSFNTYYTMGFHDNASAVFTNQPFILFPNNSSKFILNYQNNIAHILYGSSLQNGQVGLAMELTQSSIGALQSLDVLERNNYRSSVFINGEFLQRNHAISSYFARSGQEIGSLFIVYTDLRQNQFIATSSFIIENLRQLETLYTAITKQSIKRIWRLPYNFVNDRIRDISAGQKYSQSVRYQLIEADFYLDGSKDGEENIHQSMDEIIQQVGNNSILALNISLTDDDAMSDRTVHVFEQLEIFIKALQNKGLYLVPVTEVNR